jgi:hypothetical protein
MREGVGWLSKALGVVSGVNRTPSLIKDEPSQKAFSPGREKKVMLFVAVLDARGGDPRHPSFRKPSDLFCRASLHEPLMQRKKYANT